MDYLFNITNTFFFKAGLQSVESSKDEDKLDQIKKKMQSKRELAEKIEAKVVVSKPDQEKKQVIEEMKTEVNSNTASSSSSHQSIRENAGNLVQSFKTFSEGASTFVADKAIVSLVTTPFNIIVNELKKESPDFEVLRENINKIKFIFENAFKLPARSESFIKNIEHYDKLLEKIDSDKKLNQLCKDTIVS